MREVVFLKRIFILEKQPDITENSETWEEGTHSMKKKPGGYRYNFIREFHV